MKMDQFRDGNRGCQDSTDFGIPTYWRGRKYGGTALGGGFGWFEPVDVDAAPFESAAGGVVVVVGGDGCAALIVGRGGGERYQKILPMVKNKVLTALLYQERIVSELGGANGVQK